MANNFKSDISFLRKLAVGAAGTNATMAQLRSMGFNPIELERGSTGFKIWKKTKIKRVRVPDIMCLNTGLRFESRGKTSPEISMSHSLTDPKRAWDAGMRDDDYVSIVVFYQSESTPLDISQISPVHFICVKDLKEAFNTGQRTISRPKGVEEGSEVRIIWNSAYAKSSSVVSTVESYRMALAPIPVARSQIINLRRGQGAINLFPQVSVGQAVEKNQIVAAVVPVKTALQCPTSVTETYFANKLSSVNLSERYAAAKALRYRGYATSKQLLEARIADSDEDIYVQLEAAAALAVFNDPQGWQFITNKIQAPDESIARETQLETIIVASEIPDIRSESLLIEVLRDDLRHDEIRAAAAWALGQFVSERSASVLVDTFNDTPLDIKTEAARALLKIAEPQVPFLINLLANSHPAKRDGLAWVLARTGKFNPTDVFFTADDNLRRWMSYIIGTGKDRFLQSEIEQVFQVDPEVYFAASVLWQIVASWVYDLGEY
jgi:hypothetical protein